MKPPSQPKTYAFFFRFNQIVLFQLVKTDSSSRIMVCTDSNMAADHVASQIIKYAHQFKKDKFLLRANSNIRNWYYELLNL